MKTTRRRRKRQVRPQVLAPERVIDRDTFFAARAFVLPGSKSKHGGLRSRWGQIQFTMRAIITICGGLPPKNFNASKLTRDIRAHLARDPDYHAIGFPEISRPTVLRAVKALWDDNPAHRK